MMPVQRFALVRLAVGVAAFVLLFSPRHGAADPSLPAGGDERGRAAYLEGLDDLQAAKYADADDAFSKALDADEDDADNWLARGVARALGEKLQDAERDLTRASRLNPQSEEVRCWLASVVAMEGDFQRDSTIFPQYTHDQAQNAIRTAARSYGRLAFVQGNSGGSPPDAQFLQGAKAERDAARQKFPQLAAAFAARVKGSNPQLAPMMLARVQRLLEAHEYARACDDLERAASADPNNLDALRGLADCNAHLAAPAAAREQYTAVLTARPSDARAWAGRAFAAAEMGDAARSASDLKLAASIDPAAATAARAEIDHLPPSGSAPKWEDLPALVDALQQAGKGKATDRELLAEAAVIVHGVNAHRRYADETYLDRRLELTAAAQRIPPTAAALADLGEFLYRQATTVRGEAVEPRAAFRPYRPQTALSQQDEIAQAEEALDRAIAADARNVKALTFKGACLAWRLQWSDAEAVLQKALAIDSAYPPLLEVFSQLLDHAAGVRAAKAANLRRTQTWSTLNYIYWRYPSQAELDQADAIDEQAQRLWALAEQSLQAAARDHAGKRDGFYFEGVVARRNGDLQAARAAFEQCLAAAPDDLPALDQLGAVYGQLGMQREAFAAEARATNLVHTTAGPMLRYAWGQIGRTAWRASRDACRAAIALDPADPRSAAYLGAIAEADGRAAEAMGWYRAAAALEQARGALNAATFDPKATGPLSPEACGLLMAVDVRLGKLLLADGRNEQALAVDRSCAAMAGRVEPVARFRRLPGAMIPDANVDPDGRAPTALPDAPHVFEFAAWAHLGVADALRVLGKSDEAIAEYRRVVDLETQKPPTIDAGNGFREPIAWATLRLAQLLLARNDVDGAAQLTNRGLPWNVSKDAEQQWREVQQQVRERQAQQNEDQWRQQQSQFERQYRKQP